MKFILLMFLISANAQAVDFGKVIGQMKQKMNKLLGNEEDDKGPEFPMPPIPQSKLGTTSNEIYKKEGKVYVQGVAFKKLSQSAKRSFRFNFVSELYQVVRGAEAKNSELVSGVNRLEQGGSREAIYRSLVLGPEYRVLEAYEEVPSDEAIKWTIQFGKKYLALAYNKNDLAKINIWSIKRVFVEKTLEVMDAFPKDGENLYRWYAHLSLELSRIGRVSWKNKTRGTAGLRYHYLWAQKVPFQHVKSEVIIKLHKVFNSFN